MAEYALFLDLSLPSQIILRLQITVRFCTKMRSQGGLQAMAKGGELTVSLLQTGHTCQITITDTGIGMEEEELASLFVPFFTTKRNGNGLGLVETKKIITTHGGTIDVHSKPAKGSSFIIHLPLRRS